MGKDWERKLREKMEGFQVKPNDAVWDTLKKELEKEDLVKVLPFEVRSTGSNSMKRFFFIVRTIAAVLLLFFGIKFVISHENTVVKYEVQDKIGVKDVISDVTKKTDVILAGEKSRREVMPLRTPIVSINVEAHKNGVFSILPKEVDIYLPVKSIGAHQVVDEGIAQEMKESSISTPVDVSLEDTVIVKEETVAAIVSKELKELSILQQKLESEESAVTEHIVNERLWSANMLVSDFLTSDREEFPGYTTLGGDNLLTLDEVSKKGTYSEAIGIILKANRNEKVATKVRHKTPVTFGVSMSYNLSPKLSVGSGLTYTKLSAETASGSISNKVVSDQVVHYVGIPLQLNYTLLKAKVINAYASGGVLVEKAISGREDVTYYLEDQVIDRKGQSFKPGRLHTSAHIGFGIDKALSSTFSIFAEPVMRYHFNEGGSLRTLYKEKPLTFNLKLGVRINL